MKSYALHELTRHDLALLARATHFVSILPDTVDSDIIRCHELAWAIGTVLGLTVVDGQYGIADHSWCEIKTGTQPRAILDVYAVGQFPQVQLLVCNWKLAHTKLYVPGPYRSDIRHDVVDEMVAIFRKADSTHG